MIWQHISRANLVSLVFQEDLSLKTNIVLACGQKNFIFQSGTKTLIEQSIADFREEMLENTRFFHKSTFRGSLKAAFAVKNESFVEQLELCRYFKKVQWTDSVLNQFLCRKSILFRVIVKHFHMGENLGS